MSITAESTGESCHCDDQIETQTTPFRRFRVTSWSICKLNIVSEAKEKTGNVERVGLKPSLLL